jgi:hypothetical protein
MVSKIGCIHYDTGYIFSLNLGFVIYKRGMMKMMVITVMMVVIMMTSTPGFP